MAFLLCRAIPRDDDGPPHQVTKLATFGIAVAVVESFMWLVITHLPIIDTRWQILFSLYTYCTVPEERDMTRFPMLTVTFAPIGARALERHRTASAARHAT